MKNAETMVRVLILDRQEIFADGLKYILEPQMSIDWIDHPQHNQSIEEIILELHPDIIFIDVNYPDMSVESISKTLKRNSCNSRLIALSTLLNDQVLLSLMSIDISGYLLKTCKRQELIDAINLVREGKTFFCTETTNRLRELVVNRRYQPNNNNNFQLSEKERSILELICAEYTSKAIADQLNMSVRTVEAYRKTMQEKTGSKNSAGLILYAIKHGIVDVSNQSLPFAISV